MSTKFDLTKATQQAKFVVEKKNIPNVRAQVSVCLDVSGSAQPLFTSGQVQSVFERILPVGLIADLNKQIDVYTFSNRDMTTHIEPAAEEANYTDYIQKYILANRNVPKWSGTEYAPVLKKNLEDFGFYKKGLFGGSKLTEKSQSGEPVIIYFLTDGESSDEDVSWKLFKECQMAKTQVYFLFIGVGPSRYFEYIEKCGEEFSNVGYYNVSNLDVLKSDSVYDELLCDELVNWLKTV